MQCRSCLSNDWWSFFFACYLLFGCYCEGFSNILDFLDLFVFGIKEKECRSGPKRFCSSNGLFPWVMLQEGTKGVFNLGDILALLSCNEVLMLLNSPCFQDSFAKTERLGRFWFHIAALGLRDLRYACNVDTLKMKLVLATVKGNGVWRMTDKKETSPKTRSQTHLWIGVESLDAWSFLVFILSIISIQKKTLETAKSAKARKIRRAEDLFLCNATYNFVFFIV